VKVAKVSTVDVRAHDICDGPGCIRQPLPGRLFCRSCLQKSALVIRRARSLLLVEAQKARDHAARSELWEAGLAYLYAVQAAQAVKFGRTESAIEKRLMSLQVSCPVDLKLLGIVKGPASLEPFVHAYLRPVAHLRGEWFDLNHPAVQKVLDAMATGDPEAVWQLVS
jgi:hypothetical protein